jgi:hypothetical protein
MVNISVSVSVWFLKINSILSKNPSGLPFINKTNTSFQIIEHNKTKINNDGNPCLGLGQRQICGGIKPINGNPNFLIL